MTNKEVIDILEDMKVKIAIPRSAKTQLNKNEALEIAIKNLKTNDRNEMIVVEKRDNNMNTIKHHSIKMKSKEKETTDNYVSREKVEYMITSGKYANENYEQFIDRLVRQLKNLPSLTSTHKIGKWKQEYLGCMYDVCSECGQKVTKGFFKYNYCPNCGADMREGEE